jgi:hypothetical protein
LPIRNCPVSLAEKVDVNKLAVFKSHPAIQLYEIVIKYHGSSHNQRVDLGKQLSLCRWFRFAQLAKGKKFRP